MFRSHITRPLRWALPLAVLGLIGAALWYLRPLRIDIDGVMVSCRYVDLAGLDVGERCDDLRRERLIITGLILLACVPAVVLVLRGFLWAADTIAELADDVRRLREDREKERG